MNLKFIKSVRIQSLVTTGLFFVIFLVLIGIVGYIYLEKNFTTPVPSTMQATTGSNLLMPKILISIGIVGSAIIILGLIWLVHRMVVKPMHSLIEVGQSLTEKDCPSLKSAMIELTKGDFTVSLSVESKSLSPSINPELNPFVEVFNEVIKNLRETVEELQNITHTPCLRMCYIGADSFLEGRRCGEVMGEVLGGKGEVTIVTSLFSNIGPEMRRKGFENVLREKYPKIQIVHVYEDHEFVDLAYKHATDALKRYPRLAGFYITHGSTPSTVARAVVEAKKAKKVAIVGHDLTDETMRYVKEGIISATLGQNPFAQGHDPVIHLFNNLVDNWQPSSPRLLTRMDVVTPKNYHQFWKEGQGLIQFKEALEKLVKPIDKQPPKPLRIAVLGVENSAFWIPVKEGALYAAEKLKPYHVEVEWIYPEEARIKNDESAAVYGGVIERLMKEGYDGISTVIIDKHLVSYINRAVESGIPVVTFNSEPSSLRSLVFTVSEQAQKLMGLSQMLATSTAQVNQATAQISKAMNDMAEGAISQNEQIGRTSKALNDLLNSIDSISKEAEMSASAAESTSKAVITGTTAMEKTISGMQTIEKSVTNTWHIVEELSKHSERIDVIVELINDIASRVNVLGLNAAIEVVRAGEYGKGFGVVAYEIRKLAKDTTRATGEIFKLISGIRNGIGEVGSVMGDGLEIVKGSAELTDKAVSVLGNIRESVEVDQKRMKNISVLMSDMKIFSRQVGEAMENVALVSEKNNMVVEDVNVSTKEMSTQLGRVSDLAKSLEMIAQGEQELLAKFNLDEDN